MIGSAAVVAALAAAAALGVFEIRPSGPALAPQRAASTPSAAAPVKANPALPILPSFDVVKVAPDGTAVVAGRAAPGARVAVLDGDKEIGAVTADRRGEWVLIPDRAIPPGDRVLSLRATGPDGGAAVKSADTVAVSVAAQAKEGALAIALPPDAALPVRVLQPPGATASGLSLGVVEYGSGGRVTLSGHAAAGATVRVYLGDRLFDTVTANAAGAWSTAPSRAVPAGAAELRLEQFAANGRVAAQLTMPFAATAAAAAALPGEAYTVQPGNNLWRIARHAYGNGNRYLVIFSANRPEIRNPDLIYPGQVFKVPKS